MTPIVPIKKLLVANRGEIAIRVFRACTELHIQTIAVYTYEDRYSLHRYKADEAYQIGADNDPIKPYLNIQEIISLAKKLKVDAIHPGYGFLSENPEFASACIKNGIAFIGPEPEVMNKLGNKVSAKIIAQSHNIPLIKGSKQVPLNTEEAILQAREIGYPVILKAAAGGGGRGMRIIRKEEDILTAFPDASREAEKAFGDASIFIEKYLIDPKHLEVQLVADKHGNIVHLYERDCSIQRRFQKLIEFAPSVGLKKETLDKVYDYAVTLGKSVNLSNICTVEFLIDKEENIYFIEVNPRIQVEHTVTEMITGVDLVKTQLKIAQGHALGDPEIRLGNQDEILKMGFALQCRITTEDPENDFKPDFGKLITYRNATGMGIRLDEGSSYPGVTVSPFFDSMLVKVSAWGRKLSSACERMNRALLEFRIRGVKTNIPFLINVINHPVLKEGKCDINFINKNPDLFEIVHGKDRGTKTLKYIADIIVNGNPDVKLSLGENYVRGKKKKFSVPFIPDYDKFCNFPEGTKQKLTVLGPEKFCRWLKEEKSIHFTDCTFRDAHQSLLATRLRTLDMLAIAEIYAKKLPGVFSLEVWGGATFDVAMRFHHEDPWFRLREFRKNIPNILLQMLFRGSNAVGYSAYPNNLIERFITEAAKEGIDIFRIFDSLNWLGGMQKSIEVVREKTNSICEACICYTGDIQNVNRKKYNLSYYVKLAQELKNTGAHIIAIKDMAGLLKPYAADILIRELKEKTDLPIHLHTHDTSSVQSATYLKAIEAGVDVVDVALSSLSGFTSQPGFNSMVAILQSHPRENVLDLETLNSLSNYFEAVREVYYPFECGLMSGTAEVYEHEIPGGQYSNLKPQAASLGLAGKWEEIKKTYREVSDLFGDVIKVTPSSKVVGDMALFMVANGMKKQDIMEKGNDISFPESVISYFKGEIGQPYGGFNTELQKIILKDKKPFTDLPNNHLSPIDFDMEFTDFRKKFGGNKSLLMTDFLSYKLFPKVFMEYYKNLNEYGYVSYIPSDIFFHGMKEGEDVIIPIAPGKSIIIRYVSMGAPDDHGVREVFFKLNGQNRSISVLDKSVKVEKKEHPKAILPQHIGAPLPGLLSKILVKKGDTIKKNQPLMIIEAMKMETTVTSVREGKITEIILNEGTVVDSNDLVLVVEG
ncbi:MAG: pyruvate carboxylase [Bacteroidetes bacterium RIFCSPLOWO2_12_FULL_37_12]|nr:MAG: pyruvate carboxylase [Bacteroidetes bacterium RIFCSPLOWO2_12_FULL_37_12]